MSELIRECLKDTLLTGTILSPVINQHHLASQFSQGSPTSQRLLSEPHHNLFPDNTKLSKQIWNLSAQFNNAVDLHLDSCMPSGSCL